MTTAINRQKLEREYYDDEDIPQVHYRRSPKRMAVGLFLASYAWALLAIIAMNVAPGTWWPVIFSLGALLAHLLGFTCLTAV